MEQSFTQSMRPVIQVFKQYHTTIVTIVIAILVGSAVFWLSQLVALSGEKGVDGYTPVSKTNGSFDQTTINRINVLHTTTDQNDSLVFPSRPSPFVE